MKKTTAILTALMLTIFTAACGAGTQETTVSGQSAAVSTDSAVIPSAAEPSHAADPEAGKTVITEGFTLSGGSYTEENGVYTITAAGTYTASGVLNGGQIVIDAGEEKVELILNGAVISSASDAPIKILSADKVTLTVQEGSYNEINDERPLKEESDTEGAGGAVYAKCDLTVKGSGALVVKASYNNGIHTTKDLKISKLNMKVTAPNNALKGNDSVTVESGSLILISTGGDGIKTDDSDVSSKGNQRGAVMISGGIIDIYAACDGIDAAYDVEISGAETAVNIFTDSYSSYTGTVVGKSGTKVYLIMQPSLYQSHTLFAAYYYNDSLENGVWAEASYAMNCYSGRTAYSALELTAPSGYANVAFFAFDGKTASLTDYAASTSGGAVNGSMNAFLISSVSGKVMSGDYVSLSTSGDSTSAKGIKADNEIRILDGTITVQSSDDAVHANGDVALENGSQGLGNIIVSGGDLTLTTGDDGIHGDGAVSISGGIIRIPDSYEGVEGNTVRFSGGETYIYARDDGVNACAGLASPLVEVSGGVLTVTTASGDTDGIDSNGSYLQTGGFVLVQSGSAMGGMAGSVDADGSVKVSGGTIVALGGISVTPGSDSCCTVLMGGQSFSAGSYTVSKDGKELFSFTVDTNCSGGWIASDQLVQGSSYVLSRNGSSVYSWTQSAQSSGSGGQQGGQQGGGWRPGGKGGRP